MGKAILTVLGRHPIHFNEGCVGLGWGIRGVGGGVARGREREAAFETLSRSQALLLLFLLLSLSASQAVYRVQYPGILCEKKI